MNRIEFVCLITINILALILFLAHTYSIPVRYVDKPVDKIVYKDKVIRDCTNTVTKTIKQNYCSYSDKLNAVREACGEHLNNGVQSYKLGSDGQPIFTCNH